MLGKKIIVTLYRSSPVFLQNIAITIYGLLLLFRRYGKTYRRYLKIYSNKDNSSIRKAKKRQDKQFLCLLHYTIKNSPYYRELYKDVDIASIKKVDDIKLLPILTKDMLKKNIEQIYTIPKRKGQKFYTGGTTGKPLLVLKRKEDVQKRMAYLDAYKSTYGFVNNKMRSARFFGKNIIPKEPNDHVFWRTNFITKQRYYSTYYLTKSTIPYYINDLNRFKPVAIDGFVSAIYMIAKYSYEHNIAFEFKPKAIFTTAETVLPMHRKMIEKVFLCPLSDQYASNEGAPFIYQCKYGSYHECIDTGIFEHVKSKTGTRLLVTSFDSFGTPLIRYDIGDYVLESNRKNCACNSCFPIIKGVAGRSTNYLITKSRGKISQTNLSVIVSELPNEVQQVQFVQRTKDEIIIRMVIDSSNINNKIKSAVNFLLNQYLGYDMHYLIEFVDKIERADSGKYQFIKNEIL